MSEENGGKNQFIDSIKSMFKDISFPDREELEAFHSWFSHCEDRAIMAGDECNRKEEVKAVLDFLEEVKNGTAATRKFD